ncbi:cytochrome c oxidase accessory protein CcoG [Adhaeribacter radiodurans]|uniref:Cytochrome c oxidase accessory protein CcoG n=1 Tax=Adhaeribacter radiodurans TaxID=2745197 RepID=A0A7L7L1J2_9BACT|nr:cytochrome c oxidase accessory protein CcoG [Adhaeribacter radiodurans]QMU26658.1 cytochrome c oxidase accessory protein CcoG [Adhaeribacter radiodurans]
MSQTVVDKDAFRDSIATVDKEGKRIWVYPKKPVGKLYEYRKLVSYGFLALLFSGPFLKINGLPVLLLNFPERKFIIFGMIFWPQDFFILLLGFLAFVVFIILFTIVYGRLFCGWVCPQTIFLEMVFRRIEYWIEGDHTKQKALDKADWNSEKILKKGAKHSIFLLISFVIANTFLAYIIGVEALKAIVTDSPSNHIGGLSSLLIFTGIFYWVFARFREQVCTIVCPYGRLQGVMMDKKTTVIAYDYVRGEPREKLRKNQERTAGDCIDCHQCVQVCPTGIDIRNGAQQMECINCTACIDACNNIMEMIGKPKDLIKYASEENIAENKPFRITGRMKSISAVLVLLLAGFVTLLATRSNVDATILRTPGMLYQKTAQHRISNLYNISIINKTTTSLPITLRLLEPQGTIKLVRDNLVLPEQGLAEGVFFAEIPQSALQGTSTEIKIGVYSGDKLITTEKTKFLGPGQ